MNVDGGEEPKLEDNCVAVVVLIVSFFDEGDGPAPTACSDNDVRFFGGVSDEREDDGGADGDDINCF